MGAGDRLARDFLPAITLLPLVGGDDELHGFVSPPQNSVPSSTTGNLVTLPVCTMTSTSNSSSRVPKPPGSPMNACEYFRNIVLRTKKYRKFRPRSTSR